MTTMHNSDQSAGSILIWLDANVNKSKQNKQIQDELRLIIKSFKPFEDVKHCQEYILSIGLHYRILLIVSGQLGRQLVPDIHQYKQISSIYVFCMNKELNEQWTKEFQKVRAVVVTSKDLIKSIEADERTRSKVEESISINVLTVSTNPNQSTTELNGDFLHSLLLIDALLRLKPTDTDKQDLISYCKKQYQGSDKDIDALTDFEQSYSSDKALLWYTYESALYKMLNEALRIQNIDALILFRFFIKDLYEQLKENQYESPIKLYRGQIISNKELNKLQQSNQKLISFNSFLSTSRHYHIAAKFLKRSKTSSVSLENFNQVLFIIQADPNVVKSKPFADISRFSGIPEEAEVLFMVTSTFQIKKIYQDKSGIWVIEMILCGDDVHDLKSLYDYMRKKNWNDNEDIDLLSFGEVLYDMGKYHTAETIFQRLLKELPSSGSTLSKLYYYVGMIAYKKEDYDSSLLWYKRSLEILMRKADLNYINIGEIYNCIGESYRGKHDYNQALEWYKKGIECFKQANDENHPTMAILYNNIGVIYQQQEKYLDALEYHQKCLSINQQYLLADHPDIASSYHGIAIVYDYLNDYVHAMEYHEKSLQIKIKVYPSYHSSIADSYQCMGCLYYDQSKWKQALEYFEKAAEIYRRSFSSEHPKIVRIENNITRVKAKLK